jgi:HlyD family secretion protein
MQVDTNVSEADIGKVALGQETTFTVDAFPNLTFRGKVTDIRNAPLTIQNVVTYDVVIQVKNPELKLRPGMTANASILVAHKENVLKIPNAALRFRPDFVRKEAASSQSSPKAGSASASAASPEQVLDRLKTGLNLTPEQQASLARILQDAQSEIQAARKEGGPEQAKAKAKELRATNRMKIRSLLTEEQKKMYDQMDRGGASGQAAGPVYKVWTPVPEGQPVPVEIVAGISDGSFTEVVSGRLREGQEVITETTGTNNKSSARQSPSPSMRGFR